MRLPLFLRMSYAKKSPFTPNELRHSGILSLQYLEAHGKPLVLFYWENPTGTDAIDMIAERIFKNKNDVKEARLHLVRSMVAPHIYGGTQATRYIKNHCYALHRKCGSKNTAGIRIDGEWSRFFDVNRKIIPIAVAPRLPCRWCGKPVFYKPHWLTWDKTVRCNAPDCRRMEYLRHTPQSKGGIDLTPNQRKGLSREAYDTQRAINYLVLRTKELKNGRKPTSNIR